MPAHSAFAGLARKFRKLLARTQAQPTARLTSRLRRLADRLERAARPAGLRLAAGALALAALAPAPAMAQSFATVSLNPFSIAGLGEYNYSAPSLVDIDDDGDIDAFVGGNGGIRFFRNVGGSDMPMFTASQLNPFGLTVNTSGNFANNFTPTFVDIDNDGDLDAFIGEFNGYTFFFQNNRTVGSTGDPVFSAAVSGAFGLVRVAEYSAPSFVDIDGDNDLDAFIGERWGETRFFRNIGSPTSASFSASSLSPFGLADVGDSATPAFADLDNDGDFDAYMGAAIWGNVYFFENIGDSNLPSFTSYTVNPFGLTNTAPYSTPNFADIDGDNDLDLFIGVFYSLKM